MKYKELLNILNELTINELDAEVNVRLPNNMGYCSIVDIENTITMRTIEIMICTPDNKWYIDYVDIPASICENGNEEEAVDWILKNIEIDNSIRVLVDSWR